MNAKQCFNTAFLEIVDRVGQKLPRASRFFRSFFRVLFPEVLRPSIHQFWGWKPAPIPMVASYIFIFFFLFIVHAVWSHYNDVLLPDDNMSTRNFLEDYENLINYLIICEAYSIIGLEFIKRGLLVRKELTSNGLPFIDTESPSKPIGAYVGVGICLLCSLLGISGYAKMEIEDYSVRYWFMEQGPPEVQLSGLGFYYLLVNFCLLFLVCCVGVSHFSLLTLSSEISSILKDKCRANKILPIIMDKEKSRKMFGPISRLLLLSKLFVFTLMINMLLWKMNEPNIGPMFGLAVVLIAAFGIWIFSLPRYAIQRHVFRIRSENGDCDYPELRGPWTLGLSSLIDFVLFTFIINYLLGDAVGKLMGDATIQILEKIFSD